MIASPEFSPTNTRMVGLTANNKANKRLEYNKSLCQTLCPVKKSITKDKSQLQRNTVIENVIGLHRALENIWASKNCTRSNIFTSFPFPITMQCQKMPFTISLTPSNIREIEGVLSKNKKQIDYFRGEITEEVVEAMKNLPNRAGDGVTMSGGVIEEKFIINETNAGGKSSKIIVDKISRYDTIENALDIRPKDFLSKISPLTRIYSSKAPIEALLEDCDEDGSDCVSEKSLAEDLEFDSVEVLRKDIDHSDDVYKEMKSELKALIDAVHSVLLNKKVAEKIEKAQRMAGKLKEVWKTAREMADFNNVYKPKYFERDRKDLTAIQLECSEIRKGCYILTWTLPQSIPTDDIAAFSIYVHGELQQKVRNPMRRKTVLANIQSDNGIVLYAELLNGDKVQIGST